MDKYYTPEIEDLYIGYECEERIIKPEIKEWKVKIIDFLRFYAYNNNQKDSSVESNIECRTKYLDKEDIESLGWKFKEYSENLRRVRFIKPMFLSSYYELSFLPEAFILIFEKTEVGDLCIFNGECKSINELKKIMKWLNIN